MIAMRYDEGEQHEKHKQRGVYIGGREEVVARGGETSRLRTRALGLRPSRPAKRALFLSLTVDRLNHPPNHTNSGTIFLIKFWRIFRLE